jgi:hypothetical protein
MTTATTTHTALLAVANDVPEFDPSFVSNSGSKAWDAAAVQLREVRIDHDVWQREDGTVYGATRADFGTVTVNRTDGSESIHIHATDAVVVRRNRNRDVTVLTITTADGKAVDVYLHGEHGSHLPVSEKLT